MDKVKIRPATKEDVPSMVYLSQLLAEYLKELNALTEMKRGEKEVLRDLFGETKYAHAIVAELFSDPEEHETDVSNELPSSKMSRNKRIIGHAIYYYGYSTWDGPFLYIDDAFVKSEMRRNGIGTALFRECAKIAVANECTRMTWQVLDWNTDSIQFFDQRIGATCEKEWLTYKMKREEFTRFSQGDTKDTMAHSTSSGFARGVMDKVKIRPATKEDLPTILYLTQLLAEFEKEPNSPKLGEREVLRDLFGEAKYAQAIVVELLSDPEEHESDVSDELPSSKMSRNKRIVGHAIYYYGYSTWAGHYLYIEDAFVKAETRSKGIGTVLFRECAKIAVANECSRMTWQVLDWNTNCIRFYDQRIGATCEKEWLTYKIKREDLTRFSQEGDTPT